MKYAYIHREGCGKQAFYLDHIPAQGTRVEPEGVTLLDGSAPLRGAKIICGNCGEMIPTTFPWCLPIENVEPAE